MKQYTKIFKLATVILIIANLNGCVWLVPPAAAVGVNIAKDRRTSGTIVDDNTTSIKVRSKLIKEDKEGYRYVTVSTYNHVVLLTGHVLTEQQKAIASKIASESKIVDRVYNAIEISTDKAKRSKDSWITTRIKSKFMMAKNLNSNSIKVVTENQTVYLMGLVTPEEEEKAVDIATKTSGVKEVIKLLEVV